MRYHYQSLDHGLSELPIAVTRRAMVLESGGRASKPSYQPLGCKLGL